MIAGFVKAFNVPFDVALYEMSYANMMLYSASLPSYSNYKKEKGEGSSDEVVKADDPTNRANVLAILNGQKF